MNSKTQNDIESTLKSIAWFSLILLVTLSQFGCQSVRLVSDYDEMIDKGVTSIQKKIEMFLTDVEKEGRTPSNDLSITDGKFFDEVLVDISSLRLRAEATLNNEITIEMLESLNDSVLTLKTLVKEGISTEQVKPIRSAINTSVGAILKFEIAKKRGEKESKS